MTHTNLEGEGIASEPRPGTAIDGIPKGHPVKDSELRTAAPSPSKTNLSRLETTSGTAIETQTKGHPKPTAMTRRDSQNPRPHRTAEASAAGHSDSPTERTPA